MWLWLNRICRTEESGERGTENENKKQQKREREQLLSGSSDVFSQVLSRKRFNHPRHKQPKQWLASIAPSGSNMAPYRPAQWPCARGPAAAERPSPRVSRDTPLLHTSALYNSRSKQSRAPFLYCMSGRGQRDVKGQQTHLPLHPPPQHKIKLDKTKKNKIKMK